MKTLLKINGEEVTTPIKRGRGRPPKKKPEEITKEQSTQLIQPTESTKLPEETPEIIKYNNKADFEIVTDTSVTSKGIVTNLDVFIKQSNSQEGKRTRLINKEFTDFRKAMSAYYLLNEFIMALRFMEGYIVTTKTNGSEKS